MELTPRAIHREESGAAMALAIVMLVLLSAFVAVLAMNSIGSSQRASSRAARIAGYIPADSAIQKYQLALNSDLAQPTRQYYLRWHDLCKLAVSTTDVANGAAPASCDNVSMFPASHTAGMQPMLDAALPPEVRRNSGPACTGRPADCTRVTMMETMTATSAANTSPPANFWQVLQTQPPNPAVDGTDTNLVVVFRAWQGVADATSIPAYRVLTKPRTYRVAYRVGSYADYQLLTDGPLHLENNFTISGKVFSNGYDDGGDTVRTPPSRPHENHTGYAIWGDGKVSCVDPYASVDSLMGKIDWGSLQNCHATPSTDNAPIQNMSLLRVEDSFRRIQRDAASSKLDVPYVRQFGALQEGWTQGIPFYVVHLSGMHVTVSSHYDADGDGSIVNGAGFETPPGPVVCTGDKANCATFDLQPDAPNAMYFANNVIVTGHNSAPLTIATRGTQGQASIIIVAGMPGTNSDGSFGADANTTLGLLAQGDVILGMTPRWLDPNQQQAQTQVSAAASDPAGDDNSLIADSVLLQRLLAMDPQQYLRTYGTVSPCSIHSIHASIVAEAGALTIPPQWATRSRPNSQIADVLRCRSTLTITGSIAAHRAAALHNEYDNWLGSKGWTGYQTRVMKWDSSLKWNPPPYFPVADRWQVISVRDGNADCLAAGGGRGCE